MPQAFLPKAPGDRLDYAFDFADDLLPGETLVGSPTLTGSADLLIASLTVATPAAIAWIEQGTPQTLYTLVCSATSSQGRSLSLEGQLFVGPVGLDDPAPIAPLT